MPIFYLIIAIVFIVFGIVKLKIHPFLVLLLAALFVGLLSGMSSKSLIESINEGFGKTLGSIGLVILLGVMIGSFLENTGAAMRLAQQVLRLTGERRVETAMGFLGFLISIPVFADSGFVILNALNKSLTQKANRSIAKTATALAMGLMASHVLVPPTPGPIAAASIVGADVGLVIFWGILVGILALIPILLVISRFKTSTQIVKVAHEIDLVSEQLALPSLGKSVLPIILPLFLIVLKSTNDYLKFIENDTLNEIIALIGTPIIALFIGLAFSLLLPQKLTKWHLSEKGWIGKSIVDAAPILMITGAGGVFGKVLQNSGIGDYIGTLLSGYSVGLLLPFVLAAALKTAQGSSTVAMITTASIVAPMLVKLGFVTPTDLVFITLTIGAGSMVVSHVNDSFFWVVTQLSGLDVKQGYRFISFSSGVLGCFSLLIIILLRFILHYF